MPGTDVKVMTHQSLLKSCTLCPRRCGVDRTAHTGFCGEGSSIRIARYSRHYWEEPCISGDKGSGTVFFSGCSLKCVFCQNFDISQGGKGYEISAGELSSIFLELQDKGVHNINLVTATHFVPMILDALDSVKGSLNIPVVYNCGGYENEETIKLLEGYIDIFLPDIKYYDSELSMRLSKAEDYFERAIKAIRLMADITGKPVIDENGIMKSGVIVRHLVLPNHRKDSIALIEMLKENFDSDEILISLMSQFTPTKQCEGIKDLNRRTTTFEYKSVLKAVEQAGFDGFLQERTSAKEEYIPEFFSDKKVTNQKK